MISFNIDELGALETDEQKSEVIRKLIENKVVPNPRWTYNFIAESLFVMGYYKETYKDIDAMIKELNFHEKECRLAAHRFRKILNVLQQCKIIEISKDKNIKFLSPSVWQKPTKWKRRGYDKF